MPGRATGNQRESKVADDLDRLGYAVVAVKGSGARGKKMRKRNHAVVGDLLAIPVRATWKQWLQVSVGAHAPGEAFKEFDLILPGFRPLCILYRKRAKKGGGISKVATARYYVDRTTHFGSLAEALREISER